MSTDESLQLKTFRRRVSVWWVIIAVISALWLWWMIAYGPVLGNEGAGVFAWMFSVARLAGVAGAVLVARRASRKPTTTFGRVMAGLAAAAGTIAALSALALFGAVADPHDQLDDSLVCGFSDNSDGCHNIAYFFTALLGVVVDLALILAMAITGLLWLLAIATRRLRR